MRISEASQEILEKLWTAFEEKQKDSISLKYLGEEKSGLGELIDYKMINVSGDIIEFTPQGRSAAEDAIRRHRLAERLLNDVIATKHNNLEENACKFEHLLYEGIDNSICTLLGHPKVCPHGKPIPPGECCYKGKDTETLHAVSALTDLNPGQGGKIAYVLSRQSSEMQKLMSIGILPGTPILMLRGYPSYVFEVGNTQYAVDKDIANAIYVRIENDRNIDSQQTSEQHRKRKRWMRW